MKRQSHKRNRRKKSPFVVVDRASPLFDENHYSLSCKGKTRYETEWQAKYDADYLSKNQANVRISWYKCPYCGHWHLTSRM